MSYFPRVVDSILDTWLPELPAISIEGAKGVGKTATARRRARSVFSLDDPGELEVLRGDPGLIDAVESPGGPRAAISWASWGRRRSTTWLIPLSQPISSVSTGVRSCAVTTAVRT